MTANLDRNYQNKISEEMPEIEISEKHIPNYENTIVPNCIERISEASYDEFFLKFMVKNKPCIISSQYTKNWPCRHEWVLSGCPNLEELNRLFGDEIVPVADCNKKYYNSQSKNEMTMKEYLTYWINYKQNDYSENLPLLYLKDWHCIKKFPKSSIYEVPPYFASDWLNEYYIAHPELNDDYMFVYMGPRGTWTPLHVDVFSSYSWSANIVGKKRWLLFPPNEENYLRDSYNKLIYDATSKELNDRTKYKLYDRESIKCFDVIQQEGEIIFVPSGWHHQVWNLEDTISINHNWINACNIKNMWTGLKNELSNVMKEIEDCKDMDSWPEQCQLILKTSYGMDFMQFLDFLIFIGEKRLEFVKRNSSFLCFDKYHFGINHCLFDLRAIRTVLEDFMQYIKLNCIYDTLCKNDEIYQFFTKITSVLQPWEYR